LTISKVALKSYHKGLPKVCKKNTESGNKKRAN